MTPEQVEQDVRAFVARYEAMPTAERIDWPLFLAWFQSKQLLEIIDGLRSALAHTPTRATKIVHLLPPETALPAAPAIAPPREPTHFLGDRRGRG